MAEHRRVSTHSAPEACIVRIERIGAEGDGVATLTDGSPVYVPFSLPGELVRVVPQRPRGDGWSAQIAQLIEPSPGRIKPPCEHFGSCGGCAVQHWAPKPYLDWKSTLLKAALERAGFEDPVLAPFAIASSGSRRRMDLALRRAAGRVVVGLHQAGGTQVVDLQECPVAAPELFELIPPLRSALLPLSALRREGSAIINLLSSGPDLLLRTDGPLDLRDRQRLIDFARQAGVVRISWAGLKGVPEAVCVLRAALTKFGQVSVSLPAGGFLQATEGGEAAIMAAVSAGLPKPLPSRASIAELYAGCGTLTFALAQHGRITAWEGDEQAVAALSAAARKSGLAGRIEAIRRDLARQPLSAAELRKFAAVVLDPPFAGAARQIEAVAEAGVRRVVYVSCNPSALARDARVLRGAGYRLLRATPIDQFLWSARLESVVIFDRD